MINVFFVNIQHTCRDAFKYYNELLIIHPSYAIISNVYKYKQKTKNKTKANRNKKLLIGSIVTVSVIGLSAGFFIYKSRDNQPVNEVTTDTGQTVNYTPATTEEKKEAEDKKEEIVKQKDQKENTTSPSTGKVVVKPTITNTTGSINAYVSGIFEEGGTCTAIFTKDSTTLTKTAAGFQNVSYTQCAPIDVEPGFLSPGQWTIIVKYVSDKSEGSSDPQTIEVK